MSTAKAPAAPSDRICHKGPTFSYGNPSTQNPAYGPRHRFDMTSDV